MSKNLMFRLLSTIILATFAFGVSVAAQQKNQPPKNQQTDKAPEAAKPGPNGPRYRQGMPQRRAGMFRRGARRFRFGMMMRRGMMNRRFQMNRQGQAPMRSRFADLGLTDAQKEQIQAIMKSSRPSTAQREEMKSLAAARKAGVATAAQDARLQAIQNENKAKRDQVRNQIIAILTPEQKQRFESRPEPRQRPGMGRPGFGPGGRGQGQQPGRQGPPRPRI